MYDNAGFKKDSGFKPIIQNMIRPTLPEFGKIKIGGKESKVRTTGNGKEWQAPVKFDHFVLTTLERGDDGNFIRDDALHSSLSEKYGDKPTRIPIRLLYNDPAMNFPSRMVCYKGKTVVCSGDGLQASRVTDSGNKTVSCPCDHCDPAYNGDAPCKMNGVLSCIIEGTEKLGGVYKFRTTSFNTIQSITSSLYWIQQQTRGILAGLPLELVMNTKTGNNPKDGKPVKVFYVTVEFFGDISKLLTEAKDIRREEAEYSRDIKLIEATAHEIVENDTNEQLSDPEEFYPEPSIIEGIPSETITENGTVVDVKTGEILEEASGTDFELTPTTPATPAAQVKPQPAVAKKAAIVKPEPKLVTVPADDDDDVF